MTPENKSAHGAPRWKLCLASSKRSSYYEIAGASEIMQVSGQRQVCGPLVSRSTKRVGLVRRGV